MPLSVLTIYDLTNYFCSMRYAHVKLTHLCEVAFLATTPTLAATLSSLTLWKLDLSLPWTTPLIRRNASE